MSRSQSRAPAARQVLRVEEGKPFTSVWVSATLPLASIWGKEGRAGYAIGSPRLVHAGNGGANVGVGEIRVVDQAGERPIAE